jgi:hypothetical protein
VVKCRPLPPVNSGLTGRACNDASNRGMRRERGSFALASRTDWRQNLHRTSVDWGPYQRLADNGARGAISMLASNGERPPSAPILLSSDAFDERDRFDAWREELMLRVMRVDVDVPDKRELSHPLAHAPFAERLDYRAALDSECCYTHGRVRSLVRASLCFSATAAKRRASHPSTLDGSGVPGYGDSEISFPLLYDS